MNTKRLLFSVVAACSGLGTLMGGEDNEPAPRLASKEEIKQLFDLATARPQRSRIVAHITVMERSSTQEEVAAKLKRQNKLMEENERHLNWKQRIEIQTVRSNTILSQSSGTRYFKVQEWHSGSKYRLDQTEETAINAVFLKSHPDSYRDSYANIHDSAFSPYQAFRVNHQLRDAQLSTNPKTGFMRHKLWQALGMPERVGVIFGLALVDGASLTNAAYDAKRDMNIMKIDSAKVESIHNGSNPHWRLDAYEEQIDSMQTTRFKLSGRYLDLWTPPPDLTSLKNVTFSEIEVYCWIGRTSGRSVCVQTFFTNFTQQTSFSSKCDGFDPDGYPQVWETRATEKGIPKEGLKVVFKEIDASPRFTDEEAFAPVFPANYIISDISSGKAVVLQNPLPDIPTIPSKRWTGKRAVIFSMLAFVAVVPICVMYWMRRGSATRNPSE
ncbi:MAG: hypothetical protein IH623_07000 [Verrucomicrobia bacterium]|nr:hypothetical protein [Verrucomicrobiota bacterium]